jgi:hypothetical protein
MIRKICRGSVPVPTPYLSGQPRGDCPYNNYANDLGLLYSLSQKDRVHEIRCDDINIIF